ncbi:hypothetical protein EV383_3701 [Pseudonocardia sediminis]|uniref:HEAT repeat protein n=1 Tax=Pseudonocardia sediminis TaxID=1397368 RepID=A0A4Q7UXP3_PSEST|nr:HEAT repeat domain-containing protein [Pseudonocardia sediminis]RZT86802.1 hypothetical protein EV383_3701 [Pseudonocardia sediminis]
MTTSTTPRSAARLGRALDAPGSSERLQAVLAAGTMPEPGFVDILVARCGVEPDFYVRDMLTWALTRHPADVTVPLLLDEVRAGSTQARSQALHTLSKVGDPRGWRAVTTAVLQDPDDDVARAAWRTAVVLVPDGAEAGLAATLATQLGRGGRDVRLSLSRAMAGLGDAAEAVLAEAATRGGVEARIHAVATRRLLGDPDEAFDASVFEARRIVALMDAPEPDAPGPDAPPVDQPPDGGARADR